MVGRNVYATRPPTVTELLHAADRPLFSFELFPPKDDEQGRLLWDTVRRLEALGPDGILINVGRGSVVDEAALVQALKAKTIRTAGLDVFEDEPRVPSELIAMDHVVLFPHVGSASVHTRNAMAQLVVDNLVSWADGKGPLTPVEETPWPPKH